jgi:hypothetical protein
VCQSAVVEEKRKTHTLDTDMNVVLGLLRLSCVFIGFGEGVCVTCQIIANKNNIKAPSTVSYNGCDSREGRSISLGVR